MEGVRRRKGKNEEQNVGNIMDNLHDEKRKTSKGTSSDRLISIFFIVFGVVSRLWQVDRGNFVIWDETHFGRFGEHYINRTFYFDVHPPLAKVLIGVAGKLAGINTTFDFPNGIEYPSDVDYKFMRTFVAFFGCFLPIFAYGTAKELGCSRKISVLCGLMVLLEGSYITLTRYILLDPFLLGFMFGGIYFAARFRNLYNKPFSAQWIFSLFCLGLFLGLECSVKMAGLFTVFTVGACVISELWMLLGDKRVSLAKYFLHFGFRVAFLIVLPLVIYMASFWAHFGILVKDGPGAPTMSSLFQASLRDSHLQKNPLEVAYDSAITLRNGAYGGGLLHSHEHRYITGSTQQQITTYHYNDTNSIWIIQGVRGSKVNEDFNARNVSRFVKHGDIIRLIHNDTRVNLHSHPVSAPLTAASYEVSGYGYNDIGDDNDYWRVEIVESLNDNSEVVQSLLTRFRLIHVNLGCALRCRGTQLPEYAYGQLEVTCDRKNRVDAYNIWNIEEHINDKLPPAPKRSYRVPFFSNFRDLNARMWISNNALVPDPDSVETGPASEYWEWPLLNRGLRLCGWYENKLKVYLFGNPIAWWGGAFSLVLFLGLIVVYTILFQRGIHVNWTTESWERFKFAGIICVLGYLFHFLPYIMMARVTYMHHYAQALYFAQLAFIYMLEHSYTLLNKHISNLLVFVVYVLVILGFIFYAPLFYGFVGNAPPFYTPQLLSTWDFVFQP